MGESSILVSNFPIVSYQGTNKSIMEARYLCHKHSLMGNIDRHYILNGMEIFACSFVDLHDGDVIPVTPQ